MVIVLGSNGQLSRSLIDKLEGAGTAYKAYSKRDLDICDKDACRNILGRDKGIKFIVNTAAYTRVDDAEKNSNIAFLVNAIGTKNIAEIADEIHAYFIHISTDYVFNGNSDLPYIENSQTCPINVYGASKLEGEKNILSMNRKNKIILRTSWVFGEYGSNFLKTMLAMRSKESLQIVSDQMGSPTYSKHIAEIIFALISNATIIEENDILHVAGNPSCTWFEFANDIFDHISNLGFKIPTLNKVSSKEFLQDARRPNYSVLDTSKLKSLNLNISLSWRDELKKIIIKCLEE